MSGHVHVDFSFLHDQTWYPPRGPGQRGGLARTRVGRSVAALPVAAPGEATLALTLPVHGGDMRFRVFGGALFRPVRRPGRWDGCLVPDFRDAALGNAPWRDSPFAPAPPPPTGAPRALLLDPRVKAAEGGTWGAGDADGALSAIAARMASMAVIDGVVHRPSEMPALALKTSPQGMYLSWSVEAFDGTHHPDDGAPATCDDLVRGVRSRAPRHRVASFPPEREAEAHAMGRAAAARAGVPYLERTVVRHLDLSALDPVDRRDVAFDIRDELEDVLASSVVAWAALASAPREASALWVDVRDACAAARERPSADGMRDLFGMAGELGAALARHAPRAGHARLDRLLDRWAIESRRDLSRVAGLDAETFAGFVP